MLILVSMQLKVCSFKKCFKIQSNTNHSSSVCSQIPCEFRMKFASPVFALSHMIFIDFLMIMLVHHLLIAECFIGHSSSVSCMCQNR